MNPSVSILVLNWNGRDLTLDCLESLMALDYKNARIVVVDNASEDDSVAQVSRLFPSVQILQLDRNYGYGGGYNLAMEKLNSMQTEYLLLLNNDTRVAPDFITALVKGKNAYGPDHIYGAKIFYDDEPDRIWYAGGQVNLSRFQISHRGIRQKDSQAFSVDSATDYVTGCCLMTSWKTFNNLQGFDERFNMYAEDVDLCLRARNSGLKCYLIHSAHIWHKVSASVGGNWSWKKNARKFSSVIKLLRKHKF